MSEMSQNQEGIEPYTEYQSYLDQEKLQYPYSQPNHSTIQTKYQKDTTQVQQQMSQLQPMKVHIAALKEPISLISAYKDNQPFNETIKRAPLNQYLSPQYQRHSQTRSQIRMKILLENNRLKSNVEILRRDLDYHRANELKIAQILKESKEKIAEFKSSLKEKSKRISQVTQNNIQLRVVINELNEKVNHLNNFSSWQQSQIRELTTKLGLMKDDVICQEKLQDQINNLQKQLKIYEVNFLHQDQGKTNQVSRVSFINENLSMNTLSERSPERWGTMNELGMEELNQIKERQENTANNHEFQEMNQLNNTLRMRVQDLEGELQRMKKALSDKEKEWQQSLMNNLKKSDHLKDQVQKANNRSANIQEHLREKEDRIQILSKEIIDLKFQLSKKDESIRNLQKASQEQREYFNRTVENRNKQILDLNEKIQERKHMELEYKIFLNEKEEQFDKQTKELRDNINQLTQKNNILQKKNQELQQQRFDEFSEIQDLIENAKYYKAENQQLRAKLREQQLQHEQQTKGFRKELDKYSTKINQLLKQTKRLSQAQLQKNKTIPGILQQQEELGSQEDQYSQKEDSLPINQQYYQTGHYEGCGPLEEQEPLRDSSDSSSKRQVVERNNYKLRKQKFNDEESQEYVRLKERIQQERSAHNISLADINYKLEQQKALKEQLIIENSEHLERIRILSTKEMEYKLTIGMKDDEIASLKAKITDNRLKFEENRQQFEAHIKKINNQNGQQLKKKNQRIFQLGMQLEKMTSLNTEMSHKVINLQNTNRKYSSERVILQDQLSKIWNNVSIQNNPILEKQLGELKSSLSAGLNRKIPEESKLFFSMQIQQKEKGIHSQQNEEMLKMEHNIGQMKHELLRFQQKEDLYKRNIAQMEEIKREFQILQKQNEEKGKQLQEKEEQMIALMAEMQKALEQIQINRQTIKNLQLQSNSIKTDYNAARAKIAEFQSLITTMNKKEQKQKQQLVQKVKFLDAIINDQKSQIQKEYIEKQQLINNNMKASSDIAQSNTKIKQYSLQNELLTKRLDETQNKNAQAFNEIAKLKQQRDALKQQKIELKSKLKFIQDSIKIKDSKIEELDLNLANLQSSLDYSKTENSQKMNALRQSLTKENQLYLSVKMEEVSQTKRQIQMLNNQISQLKSQHKATVEQYSRFRRQAQKQKEEFFLKECESCAKISQLQQANFSFGHLLKSKSEQLIHIGTVVSQKEIILKEQIQLIDQRAEKIAFLQTQLERINKDFEVFKGNTERQKQSLSDNIEVRKKMMQQLEDDHQMRVNKLQKEVSTLRSLLNETEKQTSARLQQSTNSINQMQNKLKIQVQLVKQKDQELKQLKEANSTLKQQNQMLKKVQQRSQQERKSWEQITQQKEDEISQQKKEFNRLRSQFNEQRSQNQRVEHQYKLLVEQQEKTKLQIIQLQRNITQVQNNLDSSEKKSMQIKKVLEAFQVQSIKLKDQLTALKKENEISKSQIHRTQEYLQDQILQKSKMEQMYESVQLEKEQIFKKVNNLSTERQEIVKKTQKQIQEERQQKSKIQQACKQMQDQVQSLNGKIIQLQKSIIKLQKQKKEVQASLVQTQGYLQEQILQKSRVQQQHLRMLQQKEQMSLKLSRAISQKDQIRLSIDKNSPIIDQLKQQNQYLSSRISKMEKQHSSRLQSIRSEMRDHGLELQRRHSKQVQDLCEQMSKLKLERDNLKNELQKSKKNDSKQQLQKHKSKIDKYEKEMKQFENERGELTDKILVLTQENNQFNQLNQTLRNDVMKKRDQIFQYKQMIQKLQEENQYLKQNQPLSNEGLDQNQLQEDYYQLQAVFYQVQAKNQILQAQINEKIKNQRTLSQKLEQLKVKQTRQRNSSCDSWVSKSRIFVDEKSQNMQAQLQDYKCKYESAEAYILLLQQQIKSSSGSQLELKIAQLQKDLKAKKEQIQTLQAKVQYQNAYIDHLQNDNIKNSVISKKSTRSKRDDKAYLKVDKDHSVISVIENSHRTDKPGDIEKLNEKIKILNEFIENYNKEKDKSQNLQAFRKKLGSATLDQLLSTVLYRLEKEVNHSREKQHRNQEISIDIQHLQEELKSLHQAFQLSQKKLQNHNNLQSKYEQTKTMLQQALMLKVKHQMEISQFKRRIKQLEDTNTQDNNKPKDERILTASMRKDKERDGLSVLHEENQDGSSDSMMSENADSEIPSSVNQSKDLRCSLDFKLKNSANIQLKKKTLSRANSLSNNNEKPFTVEFLYKLLDKIDEIDSQVAYIQIQLQEKAQKLTQILGRNVQDQIAGKLQQIEGKMHENQRDIKRHIEKSQSQLTNLLKELIRGIQSQNEYGLQNESRKKIEEYLKLLQNQLYKNKHIQQTKSLESSRNQSPQTIKLSLHEIKEDIVNEDKSSSLVNPKTSRMGHSYSNSEGVEPFQNNQLKTKYFQALKDLKQANEELQNKEELLRSFTKKNNLVSGQIGIVLDQLLMNFQQNQYFFQQTDKIKQMLFHLTNSESWQSPIKDSFQKELESSKMILIQSNAKRHNPNDESKTNVNPIMQVAKMSKQRFYQLVQQVTNQDVKIIKKRIGQTVEERYNDCFEFLMNQKSLILDILKIDEKRSADDQAMEKLANRLTKDEIEGIINNSYNKQEARMTLMKIIVEDSQSELISKSQQVSIEDDFSPDIDKMQEIKDKVFKQATELSLLLHNQLIKILAAPTRQSYYEFIEQFYNIIRRYEQRINQQASQKQSHSEKHSMRMKKLLEQRFQSIEINDSQSLDPLMIRIPKNRSTSCIVNGTESIS